MGNKKQNCHFMLSFTVLIAVKINSIVLEVANLAIFPIFTINKIALKYVGLILKAHHLIKGNIQNKNELGCAKLS